MRHDWPGKGTSRMEGEGQYIAHGNGEKKAEPVVHVITGAQRQAEQQRTPRRPAELLEPGEQVAAHQRFLGDCSYGHSVEDVVLRHVPRLDLAEQAAVPGHQGTERQRDEQDQALAACRQPESRPQVAVPPGRAKPERCRALAGPRQQQQGDRYHDAYGEVAEDAQDEVLHRMTGDDGGKSVDVADPAQVRDQDVNRGDDAGEEEGDLDEPGLHHKSPPGLLRRLPDPAVLAHPLMIPHARLSQEPARAFVITDAKVSNEVLVTDWSLTSYGRYKYQPPERQDRPTGRERRNGLGQAASGLRAHRSGSARRRHRARPSRSAALGDAADRAGNRHAGWRGQRRDHVPARREQVDGGLRGGRHPRMAGPARYL